MQNYRIRHAEAIAIRYLVDDVLVNYQRERHTVSILEYVSVTLYTESDSQDILEELHRPLCIEAKAR